MYSEISLEEAVAINKELNDKLAAVMRENRKLREEVARYRRSKKAQETNEALKRESIRLKKEIDKYKIDKELVLKSKKLVEENNRLEEENKRYKLKIEEMRDDMAAYVVALFDDTEEQNKCAESIERILSRTPKSLLMIIARQMLKNKIAPLGANYGKYYSKWQYVEYILATDDLSDVKGIGKVKGDAYKELREKIKKAYKY